MTVKQKSLLFRVTCSWTTLYLAIALVAACGLFAIEWLRPVETAVTIEVDIESDRDAAFYVYVNGTDRPPFVGNMQAGVRRTYRFAGEYDRIFGVRLDPASQMGATVHIYSIAIASDQGSRHRISPTQISGWATHGIGQMVVAPDRLTVVTALEGPILGGPVNISFRSGIWAALTPLLKRLLEGRTAVQFAASAALLFLLLGLRSPERRWHLALVVAATLAAVLCFRLAVANHHGLGSIVSAVGRAAYLGISYRANHLGLAAAFVAAGSLAFIGHRLWHTRQPNPSAADSNQGSPLQPTAAVRKSVLATTGILGAAFLGLLLAVVPDFPQVIEGLEQRFFAPGWDANNLLVWGYLAQAGYTPMKDFWYPYGRWYFDPNHFLLLADVSVAIAAWTLYRAMTFWGVFYGFFRLTGNRTMIAVFGTLAVLIGEHTQVHPTDGMTIFWQGSRYLPSLLVVLTYLAIDQRSRKFQFAHVVFGIFCGMAMWGELTQLLYAAAAVLVILLADVVVDWSDELRRLPARLLKEFSIPAMSLTLFLGTLAAQGALAGFADFYAHYGDLSQYGAVPTSAVEMTSRFLSLDYLGLLGPIAIFAIAIFEMSRRPKGEHGARILLGIAMVGGMILLKHLVRPIFWQLFLIPAVGIFFYLVLWRSNTKRGDAVVLGVVTGAFAAILWAGGAWQPMLKNVMDGPRRIVAGTHFLLTQRERIAEVNRNEYAPERFRYFRKEGEAAAFIRRQGPPGETPKVFVLGDSNVIYILLEQVPPYQMNLYSSSPIYEQQRVVEWLRTHKPAFATVKPGELTFDDVPNVVRDPLIYAEVIASYVPASQAGGYTILRRRQPGDPIALDFWRRHLGSDVALGHLARISSFDRTLPCPPQSSTECGAFLDMALSKSTVKSWSGKTLAIPFSVQGEVYTVSFAVHPKQSNYRVYLKRVWFWHAAQLEGVPPQVLAAKLPEGVTVRVVPRRVSEGTLY